MSLLDKYDKVAITPRINEKIINFCDPDKDKNKRIDPTIGSTPNIERTSCASEFLREAALRSATLRKVWKVKVISQTTPKIIGLILDAISMSPLTSISRVAVMIVACAIKRRKSSFE